MAVLPSTGDNANEPLVVALAKLGDVSAYETLVKQHQSRIRGLLRHLSGDVPLADDLAQQSFLTAWQTLGQLRGPRAFGGWLKRIAVNLWLKHLRTNDPLRNSFDDDGLERPTHDTPDIAIDLQQALATLAEVTRTCVVLSYVEGMSHGEIADTLDLPLGTVKSHIRRGTQQLKDRLAPYQPESNPT